VIVNFKEMYIATGNKYLYSES